MKNSSRPPASSSEAASKRMRANKGKDTAPERAIATLLEDGDIPYEHDVVIMAGMRRRVDFSFPAHRIALLVDGCFWHGCPIHGTWPKNNAEFWKSKIETNRTRDADTDRRLQEEGWAVIRVWAHEDPQQVVQRVRAEIIARTE